MMIVSEENALPVDHNDSDIAVIHGADVDEAYIVDDHTNRDTDDADDDDDGDDDDRII